MIKAAGVMADGTPILMLGLSRGDTDRLLDDQPIAVDVGRMSYSRVQGWPQRMVVLVLGAETDTDIADSLLAKVGTGADADLQDGGDELHVPVIAALGRVRELAHRRRDEELLAILGEA